jgi:phosphoglycolate phosphatase
MSVQAIIFDLDGTLLYTLEDIANAANFILNKHGLPTYEINEYKFFVGDGVYRLVQRILPASQRDDSFILNFIDEFADTYANQWNNTTHPFPGISELLTTLNQQRIKLAILSNKPDLFTHLCAKEFFPKIHFDCILGHQENQALKPDPILSKYLLTNLEVSPEKTLFVGDSGVDILTAQNGGMVPVGVDWGYRDHKEMEDVGARWILEKPADLLQVIKEMDASEI